MKLTLDQKLELLAGYRRDMRLKATKLWPRGVLIYDIDPVVGENKDNMMW